MSNSRNSEQDQTLELLQKNLAIQLHVLGTTQDRIAKIVGKQKLWVNKLLRGVPKGGLTNGKKDK